jgi:hypothetical protein
MSECGLALELLGWEPCLNFRQAWGTDSNTMAGVMSSLRYTGVESQEGLTHYGLYDTVVARE